MLSWARCSRSRCTHEVAATRVDARRGGGLTGSEAWKVKPVIERAGKSHFAPRRCRRQSRRLSSGQAKRSPLSPSGELLMRAGGHRPDRPAAERASEGSLSRLPLLLVARWRSVPRETRSTGLSLVRHGRHVRSHQEPSVLLALRSADRADLCPHAGRQRGYGQPSRLRSRRHTRQQSSRRGE
jgi:hypothetical protein